MPANASHPFIKLTTPEDLPFERLKYSHEPRSLERLEPVPEPYLKSIDSVVARLMIERMSSSTELMKHAEHCGRGLIPTLNHTGLLNAAFWLMRMCVSSAWNVSASASVAK